MHKRNLQKRMKELGACAEATEWVAAHPSNDAATIWRDCHYVDWLIWFFSRVRPKLAQRFAFACADRAVREYAPRALEAVGRKDLAATLREHAVVDVETARKARDAASNAASNASNAASSAASSASYAERSTQIAALHAWAENWK